MGNRLAILVAGAALGSLWTGAPAHAGTVAPQTASSTDELAGVPSVPDQELAGYRGGFVWEGVEIGLGAEIRTFLNGQLVLQTNITWTPAGAQATRFVSGALTPVDAAQLEAGILSTDGFTMIVGDESVFLANVGQTVFVQGTNGSIQNILINRASNITAREEIDATLDLQNFGQFQQQQLESHVGMSTGDSVGQMLSGFLGN
jgi:hypothetical protein